MAIDDFSQRRMVEMSLHGPPQTPAIVMELPATCRDTWPWQTRNGLIAATGRRRPARRRPSVRATQGPAPVRGLSFAQREKKMIHVIAVFTAKPGKREEV